MVVPQGVVLRWYTTDCFHNVALIRLLRSHLPPRGRLCEVPCIIERYNVTNLYRVGRAFPEGEGGPANAGSNEGHLPHLSRSVLR